MDLYLLADIGGTNARFTLVDTRDPKAQRTHIYAVRAYPTLVDALQAFLTTYRGEDRVVAAALAAAGPVFNNRAELTNSDWICDKDEISAILGIEAVLIMNDFEAVAYALPSLKDTDVTVIQQGTKAADRPMVAIGPGTGLGVAALVPVGKTFQTVPTEAGNARYAPVGARETKLVQYLARTHGFVCAEDLVSGPGLVNLYNAHCFLADKKPEALDPAIIVARAMNGHELCRMVLDDFAAMFGAVASQVAISYIPLGGLYLTGGVHQKIGRAFAYARFLERFNTNPKVSDLLARVPIYCVHTEIPAFQGLWNVLAARTA